MKKLSAIILCLVMILNCCTVFAMADDEVKIGVYKIDPDYYYEGVVAIYTPARGDVLGIEGQNFAWWTVLVFEADEATGGYKCVSTNPGNGTDKTDLAIPANGFVIGANNGNNWPALFENATGSEWFYNESNDEGIPYSECPDYTSAHVSNDIAVMNTVSVGDIFYLNGISLENGALNTNEDDEEIFWYSDEFETYAFLSTVKPEEPAPVETPSEGGDDVVVAPAPTTSKNVALGASYVIEGAIAGSYPDSEAGKLTDGVLPETPSYSDPAIAGMNSNSDFYKENGYAQITLDLGEAKEITDIVLYISNLRSAGVGAASSIVYEYSVDGSEYTEIGEGTYDIDIDNDADVTAKNTLSANVTARYIRAKLVANVGHSWMMVSELEVYAGVADDTPSTPSTSTPETPTTADNGIVAFAVISVLALAGAVIVKKSR